MPCGCIVCWLVCVHASATQEHAHKRIETEPAALNCVWTCVPRTPPHIITVGVCGHACMSSAPRCRRIACYYKCFLRNIYLFYAVPCAQWLGSQSPQSLTGREMEPGCPLLLSSSGVADSLPTWEELGRWAGSVRVHPPQGRTDAAPPLTQTWADWGQCSS